MLDPKSIHNIHLVGVAGTGMGAFAGLLKKAGFTVRGSDQNLYSPMKEKLADWQIPVQTPYDAKNLEPRPDLVIIGNAISKTNVEAQSVLDSKLPYSSFPQALGELFLSAHQSIVVAGTHGKTTSCALLAHTLVHNKANCGFLFGGIPQNSDESFRCPDHEGGFFVVEGDEYDTAFWDKGPKFLHYRPKYLLCTSLEYDHADIYQNVDQIVSRFSELISLLPNGAPLVMHAESEHLREALAKSQFQGQVVTYGKGGDFDFFDHSEDADGISFEIREGAKVHGRLDLALSGQHNILNALGCYILLKKAGLSHAQIAQGFASFGGVKRRMEEKGRVGDLVVIDDFAHHPTAVKTTLDGARKRFKDRPLWALFEPRSASSCRNVFQDAYAQSFDAADRVLIAPLGRDLSEDLALNPKRLALAVNAKGIVANAYESIDAMIDVIRREAPNNAILLCMSNGSFGNIHERIVGTLRGV